MGEKKTAFDLAKVVFCRPIVNRDTHPHGCPMDIPKECYDAKRRLTAIPANAAEQLKAKDAEIAELQQELVVSQACERQIGDHARHLEKANETLTADVQLRAIEVDTHCARAEKVEARVKELEAAREKEAAVIKAATVVARLTTNPFLDFLKEYWDSQKMVAGANEKAPALLRLRAIVQDMQTA